jgi:hypothetical protein
MKSSRQVVIILQPVGKGGEETDWKLCMYLFWNLLPFPTPNSKWTVAPEQICLIPSVTGVNNQQSPSTYVFLTELHRRRNDWITFSSVRYKGRINYVNNWLALTGINLFVFNTNTIYCRIMCLQISIFITFLYKVNKTWKHSRRLKPYSCKTHQHKTDRLSPDSFQRRTRAVECDLQMEMFHCISIRMQGSELDPTTLTRNHCPPLPARDPGIHWIGGWVGFRAI